MFIGAKIVVGDIVGHSNNWIEWGINPHWYGIWGPSPHPGPWINPLYSGYWNALKTSNDFNPTLVPSMIDPLSSFYSNWFGYSP